MKNAPGYPLPTGELGEDEIVCQLVYLPDRPEYWQALLGALHYMTTWRAWERDDGKRGKDAAANWRAAFELTIGCWRMTCLEQLQEDVASILAIMEIPQSCCDAGDVTDGDQYTDRVEDGEGDVPQNIIDAGYADDSEDWAGFDDYKCMISHVIVDQLEARLNEIAPLVQTTGGVLGGVAALAGILAVIFGTAGLAIVFGIIAGIGATSLLYQALTDFGLVDALVVKVADNHEALACAVYFADGDETALIALNDKIDELFTVPEALILKNMNLGPTLKSLYAGRYDQQDIAAELESAGYELDDFDCSCIIPIGEYSHEYPFDADYESWEHGWSAEWHETYGNPGGGVRFWKTTGNSGYIRLAGGVLLATQGLGSEAGDFIRVHRIIFNYKCAASSADRIRFRIAHGGGYTYRYGDQFTTDWETFDETFDPPLEWIDGTDDYLLLADSTGPNGQWIHIDNVFIDFDSDAD